ncbi:MAG: PilZ domain-containing protein [Treponema sp.]|nr:PilZ domain-containing protein [Treponema sp.]
MFVLIIVVIAVLGTAFFLVSRSKKENYMNWLQFFARGKDAGFSFREIELLRRLAIVCDIEEPTSLFYSQLQLDVCIRSMVRTIRMSGENEDEGTQDFLSKLYDYRKKIEMDKPRIKNGISNSRQITEGQHFRILVAGTGVYRSHLVKNDSQYLTIARPVNTKITSALSWTDTKISVYFWREDDAGYVFDSEVLDEVFSKGVSSLKISHSESLFRTQKRKSVRIRLHRAAFLYLAKADDVQGKIEIEPGLKCFLEDLSDTGCAVTVGGKAESEMRVKIQFAMDNSAISMLGTVRSIDFKEEVNRSILHIEADPLSIEVRNQILSEVFGMLPEEDEEALPFRVLDDEAAGISKQIAPAAETPQESTDG